MVNIYQLHLTCNLALLQLILDMLSQTSCTLCMSECVVSPASSCLSVYRPAHTCGGSPKASKSIKNSSVARWCFLNQFCVIFQMHSASLRERHTHTHGRERNECVLEARVKLVKVSKGLFFFFAVFLHEKTKKNYIFSLLFINFPILNGQNNLITK